MIHASVRPLILALRRSRTSTKDQDIIFYSGTGDPSGGVVHNQELATGQCAIYVKEDAASTEEVLWWTTDGGTTWTKVLVLSDILMPAVTDATIASGTATLSTAAHTIRGEGAASDNCDQVDGMTATELAILVTGAEAITYRDATVSGGAGDNLDIAGNSTLVTATGDMVLAILSGTLVRIIPLRISGSTPFTGLRSDTIEELTSGTGCTVDGMLIKDKQIDVSGLLTGEPGLKLPANKPDAYSVYDSAGDVLVIDTTTGAVRVKMPDNIGWLIGTGGDDLILHDGTNTLWTHITGNLVFDNQAVTGATFIDLGTNTSATEFAVRSDAGTKLLKVDGAGTITAGAGMWAGAPSPASADPSKAHIFFDDFLDLNAGWTITEDDAACTQAAGDAQHGTVVLTNKAATDDNAQQITWAQETYKITSGKKLWCEARVKCAVDVTELDVFLGLAEAEDLTGVADNMPANGIGLKKDDGDTNIDVSSSDGGTDTTQAAVGTLTTGWHKLGFVFDGGASGVGTITPYVDGVAGTSIVCTYATMAEMAPIFMVRNGDGVSTQTMEIDYVKVVAER